MKLRRIHSGAVTAVLTIGSPVVMAQQAEAASCTTTSSVIVIPLTTAKHSNIIKHAQSAIDKGYPLTMVLNRVGADDRRRAATTGIASRPGYDHDEYPMAVGRRVDKADVAPVISGENRSAGAVAGNKLRSYCNGTKFRYAGVHAKAGTTPAPAPTPTRTLTPKPKPEPTAPVVRADPRFATCTEAKKHGYGPYLRGSDPEYHWYQDRDKDGSVCE